MGDTGQAKAGRRKEDYLMKFNGQIDFWIESED